MQLLRFEIYELMVFEVTKNRFPSSTLVKFRDP